MSKLFWVKASIRIRNLLLSVLEFLLYRKPGKDFKPKNICVYRIGNIGDFLCVIPALWAIRRQYPEAHITLLSSPGSRQAVSARTVLGNIGCIDELELYYADEMSTFSKKKELFKRLRAFHFDYLIQLPPVGIRFASQFRNLVFFRLLGIEYATGFYVSDSRLFLHAQLPWVRPNEVERCLQHLPFETEGADFTYDLSEEDRCVVNQKAVEQFGTADAPIMAVSVVGKMGHKAWPNENFAQIVSQWIADKKGKVAFVGGNDQLPRVEKIIGMLSEEERKSVRVMCGCFSIRQSIYFLEKCALLLTIDTGTAHMAPLSNTPCIDLISGVGIPFQFHPYGQKVRVLRKNQACSPCILTACPYGDPGLCMQAITPQEVWQKVDELVAEI